MVKLQLNIFGGKIEHGETLQNHGFGGKIEHGETSERYLEEEIEPNVIGFARKFMV